MNKYQQISRELVGQLSLRFEPVGVTLYPNPAVRWGAVPT